MLDESSIKDAKSLRMMFTNLNYYASRDPGLMDIFDPETQKIIDDYEIIAKKGMFTIRYVKASGKWKPIATRIVEKTPMCLVCSHIGDSHWVFSTRQVNDKSSNVTHVVIKPDTKRKPLIDFLKLMKCKTSDTDLDIPPKLDLAFSKFISYEKAIKEFVINLESVIQNTKNLIINAINNNMKYEKHAKKFLAECRQVISSTIKMDDINEMLLQHILTSRIFYMIYDEDTFHDTNSVAKSLKSLIITLELDDAAERLNIDYSTIELVAETIDDHQEKQNFLKIIYEEFYQIYNKKKADKTGVVYTPHEAVDFIIKSTDELMKKHFQKNLIDKNIEILDPATGTGTFIASLLKYFSEKCNFDRIKYKYENEIYANEISILPYYIASLNIEHTYKKITNQYCEFPNICWMDTLAKGMENFGKLDAYLPNRDNIERISRQQKKKICIIVGNPPYNAVQTGFNDNNPSDKYKFIDEKIKNTYVKSSTVRNKNQQYDMYKRFIRWATDRIGKQGIIAFISNNSFLDGNSDDGFRSEIVKNFDFIYVVNLKGNARLCGEAWKKEGGKIFGSKARVGIAITFFVKINTSNNCQIHYNTVDNYMTRIDKLHYLANNSINTVKSYIIIPNKNNIWLNQTDNDFSQLIPLISKDSKISEQTIFNFSTLGIKSERDEWIYDFDPILLEKKIKFLIQFYNSTLSKYVKQLPNDIPAWVEKKIKWSYGLISRLKRNVSIKYSSKKITRVLYRPFLFKYQYYDRDLLERQRDFSQIFINSKPNKIICVSSPFTNLAFFSICSTTYVDYGMNGTQCFPLYIYNDSNNKKANISSFALQLFQSHYNQKITVEEIFYYVYAVLNDPKYVKKYQFDLQREFPRIFLAPNFNKWVDIGSKLFNLHINFETQKPYPLSQIFSKNSNKTLLSLKKTKKSNFIIIDHHIRLNDIPVEALSHTFSSKCALEWVLEFYKESKNHLSKKSCDDPKIRKKFNQYKIEDHTEHIIDLLKRVCTVSVETMKLKKELEALPHS